MTIVRFYALDAFDERKTDCILQNIKKVNHEAKSLRTERCYHIELQDDSKLNERMEKILRWLLKNIQQADNLKITSSLPSENEHSKVIEIGPRFNFSTPFSTNCVNICQNILLKEVRRVEVSTKYYITFSEVPASFDAIVDVLGDKMTECRYTKDNLPVNSFDERLPKAAEKWHFVPVMEQGRKALEAVNQELGLAFGEWDLNFYTNLFQNVLKRDPTTVELFDCAQSNSEHSRHWFFKGKMIIDGVARRQSLIDMIIDTQRTTNPNNTIKFSDNSSAILGHKYKTLRATNCTGPGLVEVVETESDLIFTAETHNMPTAVAPFSGATTGTGGRIRDVQGIGRGGLTIAGTAGYCVGNLHIPGYNLSYEDANFKYPPSFANPLKVIIEASNGASDYGNKFGEPVITGFAISYGQKNGSDEREEYVKPIMFSGGLGTMDVNFRKKMDPEKGNLLAKIGGPVYRIGVGGGAASSVEVQGDNNSELDFNAVQRGDAEMENKLNRVIRACIELGSKNPILAIHDQGAGGNGNVLKELVEPGYAGAVIFSKEFQLGDPTITALELWGAEYQENDAILCRPEDRQLLQEICDRERCPISFVGIVTGNGYVTLIENSTDFEKYSNREKRDEWGKVPFDLHLKHVLGDMPKREYQLTRIPTNLIPLGLEKKMSYEELLEGVLSIMTVGSKRFLTNKVDRCVTGLIAQQQCVGPLHTPLADFAATTVSHFDHKGIATSIGTQPIKGLICAKAAARMSVAEAVSNLVFIGITELADVKCSGNWMWAAKLPGEGAKLYDACQEMCKIMSELSIAVDGGKDSLSMAARVEDKTIKSPGTLVISTYAPCPDVRVKVTPDLKAPAMGTTGELIWVNIEGAFRLGGSAFAQSIKQQGQTCPNLTKSDVLKSAFAATQKLIKSGKILAGHDISDGGLIVCLLEMAIAGLCGLKIDLTETLSTIKDKCECDGGKIKAIDMIILFAEECGWVLEVESSALSDTLKEFKNCNVSAYHIGQSVGSGLNSEVEILNGTEKLISGSTKRFLKQWERTSFEIEKLQSNPDCATEEFESYEYRTGPSYQCSFDPDAEIFLKQHTTKPRVAVLREEGVNSDREMIATLVNANFEVHDVSMSDLLHGKTVLDNYRGLVFPGGFSYADTLGSAKGWAANIIFSETLAPQFRQFKNREDTFSLGICNGCQLMGMIGWIGATGDESNDRVIDVPNVALLKNKSDRFECRWSTIKIAESKSIMLRKMTGSIIGCWVAHGEGRFSFKNDDVRNTLKNSNCISMYYVDDDGSPTEKYPMNPNGSVDGIAGLCSADGRHLALMPHPERCSNMFQWPYVPHGFKAEKSPWQRMFDEAFLWCMESTEH
ncbi:unnamed protein product [Hermetia illucens]|uniref:Phosphoribosylformylglycinamidine synthase n=1 Tax=Hermetia illucens TaxID=343691 RepID=A0A7R8YUE6_HERIL|nr:phosphoribosylformylglycinamidine synthase [Hermetia illucens]CAD7086107.1 unnamed protein product [Hermetia illucens]